MQAIRPYGGDIGWEDYASRMVGITDSSAARILLSEAGVSPTSEIIEQACKVKKSAYVARVVAEVGIDKDTISWITSRPEDLYLGVVSSSHGFEVVPVLSKANVLDTLDLLICAEHVQRRKPDPEPYLLAVERVNQNLRQAAAARQVSAAGHALLAGQAPLGEQTPIDPSECLVVEDSDAGVAAATAAGMRVERVAGPSELLGVLERTRQESG